MNASMKSVSMPFEMGKYEISNQQYRCFKPEHDSGKTSKYTLNDDKQPVMKVSWKEATAFAEWLSLQTGQNYRLPTEAEWEYTARAGTTSAYWWGDDIGQNHANCGESRCGDHFAVTAPVGSFAANPRGLYDTAGNVREWTCSEYNGSYDGAEKICFSTNYAVRLVLRGGSWYNLPGDLRAAERTWLNFSNLLNGFRLVRRAR